jgi:hypothetical protein
MPIIISRDFWEEAFLFQRSRRKVTVLVGSKEVLWGLAKEDCERYSETSSSEPRPIKLGISWRGISIKQVIALQG